MGHGRARNTVFDCALNKLKREEALQAAEKVETGQVPQGLKPEVLAIVYGPTKVVP
jgi:hypothetical protein